MPGIGLEYGIAGLLGEGLKALPTLTALKKIGNENKRRRMTKELIARAKWKAKTLTLGGYGTQKEKIIKR